MVQIHGDNISTPIQARSPAAQQVTTVKGLDLGKVSAFISEYKAQASKLNLASADAALLRADIATVKAQIESRRPNSRQSGRI